MECFYKILSFTFLHTNYDYVKELKDVEVI